jgi:hypothetical protein
MSALRKRKVVRKGQKKGEGRRECMWIGENEATLSLNTGSISQEIQRLAERNPLVCGNITH